MMNTLAWEVGKLTDPNKSGGNSVSIPSGISGSTRPRECPSPQEHSTWHNWIQAMPDARDYFVWLL